jgi:predicted AlkP superfamily pyrophosphatase or phosphodiesterase
MSWRRRFFATWVAAWLAAAWPGTAAAAPVPDAAGPLVLVSLDGFRWDYCERFPAETPNLRALRRDGVTARGLIPVFPSNTFPNHYTIVTGLYPANHGIVNNDFFDPAQGRFFRYFQPAVAGDPSWWGGEPIWVTAVRHGRRAAVHFWVGSETAIGGVRPTFWKKFDYRIPFAERLREVGGWLQLPAAERPALIVFYLEETNSAGHRFGPGSPESAAAVALLDARVAALRERCRVDGREPNLVVVSDHGMVETSLERTVALDDFLDLKSVQIDSDGSVVALRPLQGTPAELVRTLQRLPHARVSLLADLPASFHLRDHPRLAPVWILPEPGWHVGTRAGIERLRQRYPEKGYLAGDHGYDPRLPAMHGFFLAHGPAFRRGVELPAVESVHVYALLCAALDLPPARHDGDDRLVREALRR